MSVAKLSCIYFSTYIGQNENDKSIYETPFNIYAYVSDPSKYLNKTNIGVAENYDLTIQIPVGEKTKYINELSKVWIKQIPNSKNDNMDYSIERIANYTNFIDIYLKSIAISTKKLYYSNDDINIIAVSVVFDSTNLTAIVKNNVYFPITKDTLVWKTKPTSTSQTTNKLKLKDTVEFEFNTKFIFESVT